ncbi:hypothetical protein V6N11_052090 [Hibiscus sabdariffa]|uniref:Uncharacterized protein n=1 Tax=Hibiscus sabdariffa TaxID=183260 RepID=A0ABR2U9J4_9ROSI
MALGLSNMFFHRLVFASTFIVCCLETFTNGATLGKDEEEALRSIGSALGKKDWNFDIDPCNKDSSWVDPSSNKDHANNVTCDCSFNNNNTCHVTHILLKAQNLSGTLPTDLASLPFLQEIDLTRNYLRGNIPPQWGSATQLVNMDGDPTVMTYRRITCLYVFRRLMLCMYAEISLLGNRLTGSIPKELANLSSLTSLVLETNGFSGTLPPALGNLPKIQRLHFSSNNFTGEIPETYARLTTLKELIISDLNGAEAAFPQFNAKLPELDRV